MYRTAPFWFGLACLVAVAGFYPTYLSRLSEASLSRHVHGSIAAVWLMVLLLQSWFMRQRNITAHRALGRATLAIVPLFLFSGALVVHDMLSETSRGFVQAFGNRLAFLDITSMAYFAWTYGMALRHRREVQLHARYMASTVVLLLPPALARATNIYLQLPAFETGLHLSYAITELAVAALLFDDFRKGGLRRPYVILMVFTLFQHASFVLSPSWAWWQAICRGIGAL